MSCHTLSRFEASLGPVTKGRVGNRRQKKSGGLLGGVLDEVSASLIANPFEAAYMWDVIPKQLMLVRFGRPDRKKAKSIPPSKDGSIKHRSWAKLVG